MLSPPDLEAVGVVVPAHDEEAHLPDCLAALRTAVVPIVRSGLACTVVVVLDTCSDRSAAAVAAAARDWDCRAELITRHVGAANVGRARAAGCSALLERWRTTDTSRVWLASTDADSVVPAHWLAHQVDCHRRGAGVWVGTVEVADDGGGPAAFRSLYATQDGSLHPHVHGTNLGLTADAYLRVGGFGAQRTGEDHDLVRRLAAAGVPVTRGTTAAVVTSGRRDGRAPNGFATVLTALDRGALELPAPQVS